MIRGGARAHVDVDRTVALDRPEALLGSADMGLFASLEPALFLVDGNNLLWRAAHGRRAPFVAADGRDITPLFRFFTLVRRALGTYGLFAECIVCFDGPDAWSARRRIDETYKSNRDYTHTDVTFMEWLPEIRAALDCAGVRWVEVPDQEADDVIATLAGRAGERRVRILSTDHDYFQLLRSTVDVVNPRNRPAVLGPSHLADRYGVTAEQWCDFRALCGDPSDGIPGLPGIGPRRASDLLAGGLTLDDLHQAGRLEGPLGEHVRRHWSDLCRYRQLVRLRTDVEMSISPSGRPTPSLPAATTVCRELGLTG